MDALINATILENMAISVDNENATADGGLCVDLADTMMQCDDDGATTVDKENEGAQRAASANRSAAVGAILFANQPPNPPPEADTHPLSGDTPSPAEAADGTASPPTATSVAHPYGSRESAGGAGRGGERARRVKS